MRQLTIAGFKPAFTVFAILSCFILQAQSSKIDWSRDTVSKADAIGGKDTYVNTIRGSGQLATEKITLPVDKMKEILDACAAKGVTEITVLFVAIRQSDIARFRKNNPEIGGTNSQLKGRQLIVFRIPRHVFSYQAGSKAGIPQDNPLLLSLLSVGLMQLDQSYIDAPAEGDDIYFSIGTICPPPASCDL
jgi:hypothetical protein